MLGITSFQRIGNHVGVYVVFELSINRRQNTALKIAKVRYKHPISANRLSHLWLVAVFGHAIHLTGREAARLAETGASVAHCPTSNQFLGSGECDVRGLMESGVRVGLATDVGGGSSFSIFHTMKAAYEVGQRRGASLSPVHLWWLATAGSAAALGIGDRVGNLAAGLEADAVVLDVGSTPILRHRVARADSITEVMFAQIVLADDRAVTRTISGGNVVYERESN